MRDVKGSPIHWGKLQKECHKWMDDLFDTRDDAYLWLRTTFDIRHFSELKHKEDLDKLIEIHRALYVKWFKL